MPSESTNSYTTIYTQIITGGIGLVGTSDTPDLLAVVEPTPPITSGSYDLNFHIKAVQSGYTDLASYIVPVQSGTPLDLSAEYVGLSLSSFLAFIRPTKSGTPLDLGVIYEPILPADLPANLTGFSFSDLNATISAIEPVDLLATISGMPREDLFANLFGYAEESLNASLSGFLFKDLTGIITGLGTEQFILNANLDGFFAIEEEVDLLSYIIGTQSGYLDLESTLTGVAISDLEASISGAMFEYLGSTVTGILFEGSLSANITPTGSLFNLSTFIRGTNRLEENLVANVDGTGVHDLQVIINSEIQEALVANIEPTGENNSYLYANILANQQFDLTADYTSIEGNLLNAVITSIDGELLNAAITPRVFYIDSTIPINTFPFKDLKVVVNGLLCPNEGSGFSDLQVSISGNSSKDLQAEIIAVTGQYAVATDLIPINIKNFVITEDWLFYITEPPAIVEDQFLVIITNSPLSDLSASIVGIQESRDLTSNISPVYIPSVSRPGVSLGQWVNLQTGETKIIRLFFRGSVNNFYYSNLGNTTYPELSNDFLEIVVETYKKVETGSSSLLNLKTEVKRCVVDNLSGFPSIDDAVKYAIMCAAGEVSGELSAVIYPVGVTNELPASVSGIDSNFIKDLKADLISVTNAPDIAASITPTGSLSDLTGDIYGVQAAVTSTPFFDSNGNRFLPELIVNLNGDYSVVLTPIPASGIIEVLRPDLQTTICGVGTTDLFSTVSGL